MIKKSKNNSFLLHYFILCMFLISTSFLFAQNNIDSLWNQLKEDYREYEKKELDSIRKAEKEHKKFLKDSLKNNNAWKPDPKKATLWALLPGAGQSYNHKYWKMPIVYAGFGTITYLIIRYTNQFQNWNNAYLYVATGGEKGKHNHYADVYDETQLLSMKEFYQSNREWCYFAGIVLYIIQILDANVDAHLYDFNVTEDLSVRLAPSQPFIPVNTFFKSPLQQNIGFTLTYRIGK